MRAIVWILVLFALAVGLVIAARYNSGLVLIVLPPWRVEPERRLFTKARMMLTGSTPRWR